MGATTDSPTHTITLAIERRRAAFGGYEYRATESWDGGQAQPLSSIWTPTRGGANAQRDARAAALRGHGGEVVLA